MQITADIFNVGVNDRDVTLFEGQYTVSHGMAYNSYLIEDEKIAVLDSVSEGFSEAWLQNIRSCLKGRTPDFLIVQHMEPDHSANITAFTDAFPQAQVVSSAKAFAMMNGFFGDDFANRRILIKEGDTLCLGKHTLHFVAAPMVHWPEVIVTYDDVDKVLFSADGFGKFGTVDAQEPWEEEARRYYIGIVGKYGAQVQALLKKAAALDIARICPLHGPVLTENLGHYIGLYDTWSAYRPECSGVAIAYASVYGHTKEAAELLAEELRGLAVPVVLHDLTQDDMHGAIADAFRFDRLALAGITYNADVFPAMKTFLHGLTERNYRSRMVGLMENGSWAPMAAKGMRTLLEGCKDIDFAPTSVKITSALDEDSKAQIRALARELAEL